MKKQIEEFPRIEKIDRYDFIIVQAKLKNGKTRLLLRNETPDADVMSRLIDELLHEEEITTFVIKAFGSFRHRTNANQLEVTINSKPNRLEQLYCKLLIGRQIQAVPMTFVLNRRNSR